MEPWRLQPARDTGLTPAERFRSVRRESGLLESFAHHACFSLLRTYFAIAHRLTITRPGETARARAVRARCESLQSSRCTRSWSSAYSPSSRARLSHRCGRRFLSKHCGQHILGNHAQRFANVAEKLRPACPCRFAPETTGRKSDLHHLPGRWTESQRLDDAVQTRTWDARRGDKRAGCPLRSRWNFPGSAATPKDSAALGDQATNRRCTRVRINNQ